MKAEPQEGQETSSRGNAWFWLYWLVLVLMLYAFSWGPAARMANKQIIRYGTPAYHFILIFYKPMEWAYKNTPLQKPLGMYLHYWMPNVFDSKGNSIPN